MLRLLKNIALGWGKSLGLLPVSAAEKKLQELRLKQCTACPFAATQDLLRIVNGSGQRVATLYCTRCSCPCVQKAIVVAENCPLGLW